jgi:DAK2 domain fusion protein YloV
LVRAGFLWLKQQEGQVNNLNVYPVPDGDTGTNMMHTMRSAWEAIANLDNANVGAVAKAVSNGALRGSRGNSGIILSQLWRGFAKSLDGKEVMDAVDMVAAFKEAAKTAYGGVSNPVEGTILTVARETAEALEYASKSTHDTRALFETAVSACNDSVQRTPTLLKILKDAGVVDSGGYGLYVILSGILRAVNGEAVEDMAADVKKDSHTGLPMPPEQEGGWGYDVQYLIYAPRGAKLDVSAIRKDIEAMGDCPLVMGDEDIVKVHVHVPDPGVAISYGVKHGSLRDVVVEDMQAQSEEFGEKKTEDRKQEAEFPEADVAIIAVASGAGLVRTFKDIGVRIVIEGGQTMNPSVDDFLNAIHSANAKSLVLLPNNGNIVMTAQQAAQMSEIPAKVVPTKTLPQGIAAAIAFNFSGGLDDNAANMTESAKRVTTGEITVSTRNVTINDVTVRDGQIIGLINDKLAVAGEGIADTLLALLEKADAASQELITLYYGNGTTAEQAEVMAEQVRTVYPNQQVDVYEGGQPHYWYVVGIE